MHFMTFCWAVVKHASLSLQARVEMLAFCLKDGLGTNDLEAPATEPYLCLFIIAQSLYYQSKQLAYDWYMHIT